MNTRTLTIGIVIAVVGLVVFLQRTYFAETILAADTTAEQIPLKINASLGESWAQARVQSDHYKELATSVLGGGLFFIGAVLAVSGASQSGRRNGMPIDAIASGLSTEASAPARTASAAIAPEEKKAMDAAAEAFLQGRDNATKTN